MSLGSSWQDKSSTYFPEEEDEKPGPGSSYSNAHVVMLCFSVDKPNSLINTENKWLDRIIERCPGVRICLAALRCDLRDDPKTQAHLAEYGQRPIDYEEASADVTFLSSQAQR
ncbi:hypothetical protein Pst134EA_032852 [Puccinia striiformis f. sp. tritici]|uniref:uncharacterized protein n=1 Tax=Puccinia striiformis f. sp. tritici TaxID=168172 RepID=UPI0020083FCA|nr:uncharacterized protein Pst134EA_032852 [Puccinia striiformis f. sp. tritici]KAH9443499.1 hypothetical protein Pst134EA_032852 [Puccinia striiformis f. sp. tritici]